MRIFLLGLFLAAAVPALSQERIAITGGKVVTNGGAPIEGGTVLMNDGVVVSVAPGVSVPAGYRQVDASGKWVTPGVIAGISQFGSSEISGNDTTNDQAARKSPGTAALMLDVALNPDETSIPVARQEGVTAAIVGPSPGRTVTLRRAFSVAASSPSWSPLPASMRWRNNCTANGWANPRRCFCKTAH